ncbi:MAG TPA: hypothetical protein DDW76_26405, partial [Cyanobacteria bacterium UBA11369]|nr:hypothetical protein [Cyanobacteria bacterium UBA11369]
MSSSSPQHKSINQKRPIKKNNENRQTEQNKPHRRERSDGDNLDCKQLLRTLVEVKKGNFSVRMPYDETGMAGKIADALNDIIEMNEQMAAELERISTVVGKEGKIHERA